jgi:hypothetical protein
MLAFSQKPGSTGEVSKKFIISLDTLCLWTGFQNKKEKAENLYFKIFRFKCA